MTDQMFDALMARLKKGDREALREIYEDCRQSVYMVILAIVSDREAAADVTSDFFIRLLKNAGSYRPGSGHKCWMARIARNMAVDHLRKNHREIPTDPEEMPDAAERTASSAEDEALAGLSFRELLGSLSSARQQIVAMKIAGQMSFKEIAEVMDMPLATVSWHYQQSMERLRRAVNA